VLICSGIYILQGGVATCFVCGRIINDHFIAICRKNFKNCRYLVMVANLMVCFWVIGYWI